MTVVTLTFVAAGEHDTERLGQALAQVLPGGTVVALDGPLGAGKTRLVQATATALGAERGEVVSPTFVLMHEYHAQRPIYHLDAYRLRDEDEFLQLGADEYFRAPNLVFIEWANRVERCLPEERVEIAIQVLPGEGREFQITGHGATLAPAIGQLRQLLASD